MVTRNNAEAEFRATAEGVCEHLGVQKVLEELKQHVETPMKLYCDNEAEK